MPWYSVRCLLRFPQDVYEERITLWEAASFDVAIERAEAEVADYVKDSDGEYIGLAQAFHLFDPPADGMEVFSLLRESDLPPDAYTQTYFATGRERQQEVGPDA
jgi:hypothetical protein